MRTPASIALSLCLLLACLFLTAPLSAQLATGTLPITGTQLTVSPEAQTVPFDTPTIVTTTLAGFDPALGTLPAGLRVEGDLRGPEIEGTLLVTAAPGEPLRIPRLRLEGEYRLEDIRLMEGNTLVGYASPRSTTVLVAQVLVTRVTSRALTLDEIRSYGIVVNDDSFQAFNFTFGFGIAGDVVDYNVPVLFVPGQEPLMVGLSGGGASGRQSRFSPPGMAPFRLDFAEPAGPQVGGCQDPSGNCSIEDPPPIPGVILFPTEIGLLNQFFSVVLMAGNGAPAGDPLVIRDLTAKIALPPGLRQAETSPPTPLGVPVPLRVPGPDGELGTADDITFLVAQAFSEAEFLVEGRREGTHVVEFALEGILDGLAGGIRRITGTARGAVVVRDPTFGVTLTHPDVVRADEQYPLFLTLSNTSNAPANLISVTLPLVGLSGVEVVGDRTVTIPSLLPGESAVAEFRLRSLRTGRVVSAAVRSPSSVNPVFELTVGVGDNGIPLSPTTIILPRSSESLPAPLVRHGLGLIGLGFSLATAPPALLDGTLPEVTRPQVDSRVYSFAQAGRHVDFGEALFDAAAVLSLEWNGARDQGWEWDALRRTTQRGGLAGTALGQIFAAEAATTTPVAMFERFAATTAYLGPIEGALAVGADLELSVRSRMSGGVLSGGGAQADRLRDLPFADLYDLTGAQLATMAVPEATGYRVELTAAAGSAGASGALELLIPDATGAPRAVRFSPISLLSTGLAWIEYSASDNAFTLSIDSDGDGSPETTRAGAIRPLSPRPFAVVAAVQNSEVDPTGHIVEVLLSQEIDGVTLVPRDSTRFEIPGKLSNGGVIQREVDSAPQAGQPANPLAGFANSRMVRVLFDNPLSPYVSQPLTVRDLTSVTGEHIVETVVPVDTTVTMDGTLVSGRVIGADGQPVPFARVELVETDQCPVCATQCRPHVTAAVRTDAAGEFLFDYVRQTPCGDLFVLRAQDPTTGQKGEARGRVRFVAQTVSLDIVLLGRGALSGRVLYDDGSVPAKLRVQALNPAFQETRLAVVDAQGHYEIQDMPVGTVTLSATDEAGAFAVTTVEIPAGGALVERDLTLLKRPAAPIGEVRGRVFAVDGVSPVFDAWVALYVEGELAGVMRSALDGRFDFGMVPAGEAEIQAFSGETGISGARQFFTVPVDAVAEVDVLLIDERGDVEGRVLRQQLDGTLVPISGAVVYADGLPFNTLTAADGSYRLEGLFAGAQRITAADLTAQKKVIALTTVLNGATVQRDLIFQDTLPAGAITGEVLDFAGLPVPGATVHIAVSDQTWFGEAFTGSDGRFVLPDIAPGVYKIHAVRGSDGGVATAEVRFIGDTPAVQIRFKKGTIRGQVMQRDAGALVGVESILRYRTSVVRLGLVGLDLESHDIQTDPQGFFELTDVLAGPFTLTAFNALLGEETVTGELMSDGQILDLQLLFESAGRISGTLYDHDGVTPAAGATLTLRHPDLGLFDVTSDMDGHFLFDLVAPSPRPMAIEATFEDGLVLRQARVFLRLDRFGQELNVELTLPKQGMVSGLVEDSNGTPMPGATVTLKESVWPFRARQQQADASGAFAYTNVFTGRLTLSAEVQALGGLGGKRTVDLTREGEEISGVVIRLEDTGEISGLILSPVDGSPVVSAELQLYTAGRLFDSATTAGDGAFLFRLLPLGTYQLRAFDPATGRAGRLDALVLGANGQQLDGTLILEARGMVDGHLYEPQSAVPVPGATVALYSRSATPITTYSSTDAAGLFRFEGVPQGLFTLNAKEPGGRRRASGEGEILAEDQLVTVDLFLEASGSVTGTVLNPPGAPAGPFSPVNLVARQDGVVIGSASTSNYHFEGIIAGRRFTLTASEPGGQHIGSVSGTLTAEGEDLALDLPMEPIGSVLTTVVDSFGAPVAGASVTLRSRGPYPGQLFAGETAADGTILFTNVGTGTLSATATDPASGLGGAINGSLTLEGETVALTLPLEEAGQVVGTVQLADGATPAAGALVVLASGNRTLTQLADTGGGFAFPAVPLGSFVLDIQENLGPGTLKLTGTVSTNGEVVDLATLVLDDTDPAVVAITPTPGSIGQPVTTTIEVLFSEPVDAELFNHLSLIRLHFTGGFQVNTTRAFADGDRRVILTPQQPLASFTSYTVRIDSRLADLAGRTLGQTVTTTFVTADVVPPAVVSLTPADGAVQVPVEVQLIADLSEPVTQGSLSGTAIQLTDLTAGTGVTTTVTLQPGAQQLLITPVAALLGDHQYQLAMAGIEDLAGNAMAPFVATFGTVDTTPPVVTLAVPAGPLAEGIEVTLVATPVATPDLVSVSFFKGAELLVTDSTAPYEALFTPSAADAAAGSVDLSAVPLDDAGNLGAAVVETRAIRADLPSVIAFTLSPADTVFAGESVVMAGTVGDISGLARVEVQFNGALNFSQVSPLSGATSFVLDRSISIPATANPLFLEVAVEATDRIGNVVTSPVQRVTIVHDVEPPLFGLVTPAEGAVFLTGDPVAISAAVTDNNRVASVSFQLGTQSFVDSEAPFTATLPAPSVSGPTDLPIEIIATDPAGHSTTFTRTIHVVLEAPNQGPPVVDAGLIAPGLGLLGSELLGQASAVVDSDRPITLALTNLRTSQVSTGTVAADGSFGMPIEGLPSDIFELVATDGHSTPLASAVVTLGPFGSGLSAPATITFEGSQPSLKMAVRRDLLAVCDCPDYGVIFATVGPPRHISHTLSLFDLSDPADPVLTSQLIALDEFRCQDECELDCDNVYFPCLNSCAGDPDPLACEAMCETQRTSCFAACGVECVTQLPFLEAGIAAMAVGDGVLASAHGSSLRLIDVRDPANPVHLPGMDFDFPTGNFQDRFADIVLDGGYLHALKAFSPYDYFVIDVHDPQNPRLIASATLPGAEATAIEVVEGRLHRLARAFGASEEEYRLFAIGDPASPIELKRSSAGGRVGFGLAVLDEVAVWGFGSEAALFHRAQPSGSDPAQTSFGFGFAPRSVAEVGDRALFLESSGSDLAICRIDDDPVTPALFLDELRTGVLTPAAQDVSTEKGRLWFLHNSAITGLASAPLTPWLDGQRVTLERTALGTRIDGAPGAASAEAATVEATSGTLSASAAVATDGSFSVTLAGVETGERIVLRAAGASGALGNLLRLRAPAGGGGSRVDLAMGARRLAIDGTLGAIVPARQDAATVEIPLVDLTLANSLSETARASVTGPVADVVLTQNALLVAAGQLEVFDLVDPAAPLALPGAALDLYAGNPVLAMVLHGTTLYTAGIEAGGSLGLYAVDVTNPLAPVQLPTASVVLPAVAAPRLFVEGSELVLIGDGAAYLFDLTNSPAPAQLASGLFAGRRLVDFEQLPSGERWVAVAGEGAVPLLRSGAALSLGVAPFEPYPAFGLFRLPRAAAPGGEQLWWAEGLGGAATLLSLDEPAPAFFVPHYGRWPTYGLLRDAVRSGTRLYLLTDFALEAVEVQP